jgi:hypothetical protein
MYVARKDVNAFASQVICMMWKRCCPQHPNPRFPTGMAKRVLTTACNRAGRHISVVALWAGGCAALWAVSRGPLTPVTWQLVQETVK